MLDIDRERERESKMVGKREREVDGEAQLEPACFWPCLRGRLIGLSADGRLIDKLNVHVP